MRHPTRNTNTYGARPRGGSRFSLAYFGRLMSCLLALSLILNSFTFTVEDYGVAIAQTADTAEYGADVLEEEERAVEELEDVDLGLEEGNDQETADQDAYLFNAGYDSEFLFSRIMDDAKLPIKKVKDVEMISVMGSLDEQDPDSKQETGEALYVEPILNDKNEISDYSITALRFFEEAGLMVYTADDYYTVRLWRPDDAAKEMEKRAQQAQALPEETEEPVPEATAEPVYEIGAAWPERLGAVLESVGLPIKPTEVENVAVLGDGDGEPDPLTVEAVDGDYLISVTRDFDEARLALYLGEEVCVLTLINGIGAEPVEETEVDVPEEPEADPVDEAVEEPVKETEIDLPTEDETETTEEIDEVEEPTEELTEETEVELITEPTAEPTEEPTVEPTEEPTAETTEEPMLEPTEEPTAEPAPEPTEEPEADLVEEPTEAPTVEPTEEPTPEPTEEPTEVAYPARHFTGSTVFVRVDVDAPEGAFPEGATMVVKPVWNSDTIADFTDAVSADNMEVDRCLVVDITFYDADGNEIEPLAPVAVEMSMAARMNEEQEALVAHMDDTGAVELMEQTEVAESTGSRVAMSVEIGAEQTEVEIEQTEVGDVDETTVAFDADGFSMYALMLARYTVDFHWGDYTYSIAGEDSILLGALLNELGVTEITLDDVSDVTFSNPELVAVEREGSDWRLTALAPFRSEETLFLALENGQTVEIRVTDATDPVEVTLVANSGWAAYDGSEHTITGYTVQDQNGAPVEGLEFEGVTASGSATEKGRHVGTVTFDGVTLNETFDTTENYVVTATIPGDILITTLLDKEIDGVDGNKVTYKVTINSDGLELNGGEPMTLRDTLLGSADNSSYTNQSINYHTVAFDPSNVGASYDYSGSTGTYTIPDGQPLTITYTTRVLGDAGATCTFASLATLAGADGEIARDSTKDTRPIYPTASEVDSSAGYMVKLLVYGGSNMQNRLPGAKFALLDANQRPVCRSNGEPVTFETADGGEADIRLDAQADGVTIEKNTIYYLDMVQVPAGYKKDNTLYSFMITDDASYDSGGVYTYFNGDTMKIRLQSEASSLNVAVRFAGNHELTEDLKNRIRVILEKKNGDAWEEVESYTYAQFDRGALTFDKGGADDPFQPGETYRVREDVSDMSWDIPEGISQSACYSLSIGTDQAIESEEAPEFSVTEANVGSSFNVVIKNEYVEHKLTLIKMDKGTGERLSGAMFAVRKAADDAEVHTYTTDTNGVLNIPGEYEGYESEVLYYVVETDPPTGYLLPLEPERTYFYFYNDEVLIPEILAGLPEGKTAINLTDSYDSLTLDNKKARVTIPVMATWQGNDWPETVASVTVQLYQSVDGEAPAPVSGVEPAELTPADPYDNTSFADLPALDDQDREITYSIEETAITGTGGENLLDSYVREYPISDSGIYIAYNKGATALTVHKEWVDLQGEQVTDENLLAQQAEVTFDVYRSAELIPDEIRADNVTNTEMTAFIASLVKVRENQVFAADSDSAQIDGLDKYYYANSEFKPYYYYVLETVPSFGDEIYLPEEVNGAITIRNLIAPETVKLTVTKAKLVGDPRPESVDTPFHFTLTLTKGDHVIRNYTVFDKEGVTLTTDWDGEAGFDLKPEQSIELTLPVGVTAAITEAENREYKTETTSLPEAVVDLDDSGRAFRYVVEKANGDVTLTFVNTLHVVCKVVDAQGVEQTFESFKSALAYIRQNPAEAVIDGVATIRMIEDYTMPDTDVFDVRADENIVLTTADTASEDPSATFPFMTERTGDDEDAPADAAIVTRGGDGGSMISNAGTLTLGKVVLDGAKDSFASTADGGLVSNTGVLNLGDGTTLRNSRTEGKGGAIYSEGTVNMSAGSRIEGNTAANGSAIYVESGALNMTGGRIENNTGASDGAVATTNIDALINLSGAPVIYDNLNDQDEDANLYIGADSGSIINVLDPGLGAGAKIGVRAAEGHREINEMFAMADYDMTANLDSFINDEYGYKGKLRDGSHTNIIWNGLTLKIQKRWEGQGVDERDTFTITITSTAIRRKDYSIIGTPDYEITTTKGNTPGTIVLRDVAINRDLTISPLPVGSYTIEEAPSNYDTACAAVEQESGQAIASVNGAYPLSGDCVVTITDTRRQAAVNLNKNLDDRLVGDAPVDFGFAVTLAEADGTPINGYVLAEGIAATANGRTTFTLSPTNDESAKLELVAPVGATMTITETVNADYSVGASALTMPAEGAGEAIEDADAADNIFAFDVTDDGAVITFDNDRKMANFDLSVKLVNKVSAPETWNVTVTLAGEGGAAKGYDMSDDPEHPITTDDDGKAVIPFTFGKGESEKSVALVIPMGADLKVEQAPEIPALAPHYTTVARINDGEVADVDIRSITQELRSIAFTNTRPMRDITVMNTVNGYSGNVQAFTYTATVTGECPDMDYNEVGFVNGVMTFELATGQNKTLSVPKGATLTVTETEIVGYETKVKHGSSDLGVTLQDSFTVTDAVTVDFTNNQLINIILKNETSSNFENIRLNFGYATVMYRVNEAGTGQDQVPMSDKNATVSVEAGKTAVLEVNHDMSKVENEQTYTVTFNTPENGYLYTIYNEPSYHEFADPAILRVYNQANDRQVKGRLRYSTSDSTITFTAQPLVSYDANGGAWTTEMEGYNDRDGNRLVYQYAVDKGAKAPQPSPAPVYPTAEGIAFLGWTTDKTTNAIYDFESEENAVSGPMTLYAVWDKPQRDTHVVTVKNSTGDSLTVSVTVAGEPRESLALAAGAYQNLTDIPDGAQLVLTASQTAMAFSDQFADEDSAVNSFKVASVTRDGTVTFAPGVCKITDDEGSVLYDVNGQPAVYATLQAAFTAYNGTLYTNAEHNTRATQAAVKMLVDEYTISSKHVFPTKDVILTTAGKDDAEFPYTGTRDRATLIRAAGYIDDTLFTHQASATSVTLENIILDGASVKVNKGVNGGLIYMSYTGAELNINEGSTLRNVQYNDYTDSSKSRGGAIYANNGTVTVNAGLFSNLHARDGGAIYAESRATLSVTGTSGSTRFENCCAETGHGGAIYHSATTDLSVNGGDQSGNSIVNGNKTTYSDPGIIFTGCQAKSNTSNGGAIYANTNFQNSISVRGCEFTECIANDSKGGNDKGFGGGAIAAPNNKTISVSRCKFLNCDTKVSGGAIMGLVANTNVQNNRAATVTDCSFEHCTCKAQGGGLAVYVKTPTTLNITQLIVTGCSFEDCSSGTANGSGGAIQTYVPCIELTDDILTDCWAGKEGGAVNNYYSNTTGGASSVWNGSYINVTRCRFYRCRAEDRYDISGDVHYGGGLNTKVKTATVRDSYFEDCVSTLKQGGALHFWGSYDGSSVTVENSIFKNCMAKDKGGAVFASSETLTVTNSKFYGCSSFAGSGGAIGHYRNVRYDSDQKETIIQGCVFSADPEDANSASCSAAVDGGAVWTRAKTVTIDATVEGGEIKQRCVFDGCTAGQNGGAVYLEYKLANSAATIKNSTINGCSATGNGGGVYTNYSANTSSVTIEDCKITENQAAYGSAVFAVNNAKVILKQSEQTQQSIAAGIGITGNIATNINGGAISAGGNGARLYFEGDIQVQDNTCSEDAENQHNVALNHDSNAVINTQNLGTNARIGVYATDSSGVFSRHGNEGDPFGTYDTPSANYLGNFSNDRNSLLYGYQSSPTDTKIYWGQYLCKITDAEGNTLQRPNGTPAVYQRLTTALGEFDQIEGEPVYIKMLVQDYTVFQTDAITNFPTKPVTLTTAGKDDEPAEFAYRGEEAVCTISRTNSTNALFKVAAAGAVFKLENITLDGRKNKTADMGDYRLIEVTAGTLEIDGGTTLQYGYGAGGAVNASGTTSIVRIGASAEDPVLPDNPVRFENCVTNGGTGGAIYVKQAGLTVSGARSGDDYGVVFENCQKIGTINDNGGGAIYHQDNSITVSGASFKNCSANGRGGAIQTYKTYYNSYTMSVSECLFTDCEAFKSGGAIDAHTKEVVISDTEFRNCSADSDGGAINHDNTNGTSITLTDVRCVNCKSEDKGVGGQVIYKNGGAVRSNVMYVTVTGCEFKNCSAYTNGGALSLDKDNSGSVKTISGTSFVNCEAVNGAGGAVWFQTGKLNIGDHENKATEINGCVAKTYSGAIYGNKSDRATAINISGGTTITGCYANQGGAIYLKNGVTMTLEDSPVFTKNGYISRNGNILTSQKGACIYLVEGSTLNISGGPQFNRNIIYADTDAKKVTNGGVKDHIRQDIYLAGYGSANAQSICITGELTDSATGIWVWPEQGLHQQASEQFAIIKSGASVSGKSLELFRNALDDGTTFCSDGEHLAGVRMPNMDPNMVYWSKMHNVYFQKIDNKGVAVPGAEFRLYTDRDCNQPIAGAVAVSMDGEDDKGKVDFPSLPIGVYYMKETDTPESFKPNNAVYLLLVGTPSLARDADPALWSNGGPLDVPNAQALVQRTTTGNGLFFGIYPLDDNGKAILTVNLAIEGEGIVNIRNDYTARFMKVDGNGAVLPGAGFTIYAPTKRDGDGNPATFVDGYPQLEPWSRDGVYYPDPFVSADGSAKYKDLEGRTLKKGEVYLSGLPLGTYFLKEEVYPERNGSNRRTFYVENDRLYRLVITGDDEYTLSEWISGNEYEDCNIQGGYYRVANTEAVCKLTDDSGKLLYEIGRDGVTRPAVYASLEEGFEAAQSHDLVNKAGNSIASNAPLKLQALKDLTMSPVTYEGNHPLTLTTAGRTATTDDRYVFATTRTSDTGRAEIKLRKSGSAMITVSGGAELTLRGINLNGQKGAGITGTAVQVTDGSLTIRENTQIKSFNGGAVSVASGSTLDVNGGSGRTAVFTDNETSGDGGAIYAAEGAEIAKLTNAQFTNNKAGENGGAISFHQPDGSELPISGVVFRNNTASDDGGAVYANGDGAIRLTNVTASGNKAVNGAGICAEGDVTLASGTLSSNTATGNGGGIWAGGDLTVTGGTLTGNKADNGGAVYVNGGDMTFGAGTMTSNTASNKGGAVYAAAGASMTMTGGAIAGNKADSGAGVYLADGVGMTMSGGSMSGNTASGTTGGAINVGGQDARISFSGSAFVYNNMDASRKQKNVVLSEDSNEIIRVTGALSSSAKIGVYVPKTIGTLFNDHGAQGTRFGTVDDTTVTDLRAFINDQDEKTFAINVTTDDGKQEMEWFLLLARVSGDGGKTWTYHDKLVDSTTYTRNGVEIHRGAFNQANQLTGDVIVETLLKTHDRYTLEGEVGLEKDRKLTLRTTTDSGFTGGASNFVTTIPRGFTTGGSMFAATAGTFEVENIILDGSKAGDAAQQGGIIAVGNPDSTGAVTLTVHNAELKNGKALSGGAIYGYEGAAVNLTGSTRVHDCEASQNGAAVYVEAGAGMTMSGSAAITGNNASNGGAVGVGGESSRLVFSGAAKVSGNTMGTGDDAVDSNVFLNFNTNAIIAARDLNRNADIGVYVTGDDNTEPFVTRGGAMDVFGVYEGATTGLRTFVNDRIGLRGKAKGSSEVMWEQVISVEVRYVHGLQSLTNVPTSSTLMYSNDSYSLPADQNPIDTIVADLMEQYGAEYEGKTDTMIFWRAFDALDTDAGRYVESVELDSINGYVDPGKWKFCKPNNHFSKADGTKLVIYYTEPAYLTIINNTTHKLVENNNMMVHGMRVYNGYGYIVEIGDDGALTYTDMPSNSALNLESGESITLMFPGGCGAAYSFNGGFQNIDNTTTIGCSRTGESDITLSRSTGNIDSFNLTGNLNNEAGLDATGTVGRTTIVFGERLSLTIEKKWMNGSTETTGTSATFAIHRYSMVDDGTIHIMVMAKPYGYEDNTVVAERFLKESEFPVTMVYRRSKPDSWVNIMRNGVYMANSGNPGTVEITRDMLGSSDVREVQLCPQSLDGGECIGATFNKGSATREPGTLTDDGVVQTITLPRSGDNPWSETIGLDVKDVKTGKIYGYYVEETAHLPADYSEVTYSGHSDVNDLLTSSGTVTVTNSVAGGDVSFVKIDGYGEPLDGAEFTLYSDVAMTEDKIVATCKSADGTTDGANALTYMEEETVKPYPKGTVLFQTVTAGTYYMKETAVPAGYEGNTDEKTVVYRMTIDDDGAMLLERKLATEADTLYKEVPKVETKPAEPATETTPAVPAEYEYRVMNASANSRKVILKKTDTASVPLQGARFKVLRADLTEIVNSDYTEVSGNMGYSSQANGVYFIDTLPFGKYYIHEIHKGGSTVNVWYTLTVGPDTVAGSRNGIVISAQRATMEETTGTNP